MGARTYYWIVLTIYAGLWGCQMFVCNSTHSLIVLTDSYINMYYIIEIALALFYIRVQSEISRNDETGKSTYRILGRRCTYQFKRLPLLGSFMNSVFLSALLMYAAIEGIQSCFHAHHLIYEGGKSILLQHELTYPGLLVGFACGGVLMRSILNSVHKMSAEESVKSNFKVDKCSTTVTSATGKQDSLVNPHAADARADRSISQLSVDKLEHLEKDASGIVLKAFKMNPERDAKMSSVYISVGNCNGNSAQSMMESPKNSQLIVKHTVSPFALIACAIVVYFVKDDLTTEITDAVLAIVVVVVVYIASYPYMCFASKTLLVTAPTDLDLDNLVADLMSISPLVRSVGDLHVWTLTNDSGRVGTCNLKIYKDDLRDDLEMADILRKARMKFLGRGIKCISVQPILSSSMEDAKKDIEGPPTCEAHKH